MINAFVYELRYDMTETMLTLINVISNFCSLKFKANKKTFIITFNHVMLDVSEQVPLSRKITAND